MTDKEIIFCDVSNPTGIEDGVIQHEPLEYQKVGAGFILRTRMEHPKEHIQKLKQKILENQKYSKKFQELRDVFKEDSPLELAILIKTLEDFKKHSRCGICGMVTPEKSIDNHIELHQVEIINKKLSDEIKHVKEERGLLKSAYLDLDKEFTNLKSQLEKIRGSKN